MSSSEETNENVCCICLEEPFEDNPLSLVACGCQSGWFHSECENQWIEWSPSDLLCPVCRQVPTVSNTYAMHWSIGEIQVLVWTTVFMVSCELLLFLLESLKSHTYMLAIPSHTCLILLCPIIFRTNKPYSFYLLQARIHMYLTIPLYLFLQWLYIHSLIGSIDISIYLHSIILIGTIHVYFLFQDIFLISLVQRKTIDCFYEFIISREIIHVKTLRITEGATSS